MSIVTRFPPSPTGYLHIGGARTALYNWLVARQAKGKMVLRIEDTDTERSTQAAVDVILDGVEWLGLDWDEGPYYQTQRFDRYAEATAQLLQQGDAYHCECSMETLDALREQQMADGEKPKYNGRCRHLGLKAEAGTTVIRFKNPEQGGVTFDDCVRGKITIANAELDDLIIERSSGTPTYNLTVVVDDMDMGMTHVVRGEDHINNTPRQINVLKALGGEQPIYAHIPLIHGEDGAKLSKRHGASSVLEYRDQGFLPDALLNYLVRLGWSNGDQEIFSRQEMIDLFDLNTVNKSPSVFNREKLLWLNQHYIKQADKTYLAKELTERLAKRGIQTESGPSTEAVADLMRDRAQTLEELAEKSAFWYQPDIEFDEGAAKKHLRGAAAPLLIAVKAKFEQINDWSAESINDAINSVLDDAEAKLVKLAQPLRVAVSGSAATPSIDATLALVEQNTVLQRIDTALEYIEKRMA